MHSAECSAAKTRSLLHIYFGHIAVHLLPLIRSWPHPVVVSFHGADVMVDMEKPAYREATAKMLESRPACSRSFGLVRRARHSIWAVPRKNSHSSHRNSGRRYTISLGENGPRWRLAFRAGVTIDREERIGDQSARVREFAAHYPRSNFTIAGEGPLLRTIAIAGARSWHCGKSFLSRFHFAARTARSFL